ncbi:MAG: hypothetical protein ABGW87_02115 [Sphingomonadaceae bacterium]
MVGERLAVGTLGAMAVDLPRLAQLAPGAGVARTMTFVMHDNLPFAAPLRFDTEKISPTWPEAKGAHYGDCPIGASPTRTLPTPVIPTPTGNRLSAGEVPELAGPRIGSGVTNGKPRHRAFRRPREPDAAKHPTSSLPRRRESSAASTALDWIPACAGMTI